MRKSSHAFAPLPSTRKLELQYADTPSDDHPKGFVYIGITQGNRILGNIIIDPDDFARIIQEQVGSDDDV